MGFFDGYNQHNNMAKQTTVDLIFEKFNTLSDADFKSWMLNNHDELKRMEKKQMINFCQIWEDGSIEDTKTDLYNAIYGGDK